MSLKLDYDPNNPLPLEEEHVLRKYLEIETFYMANEGYVGDELKAIWRERAVLVIFKVSVGHSTDSIFFFILILLVFRFFVSSVFRSSSH